MQRKIATGSAVTTLTNGNKVIFKFSNTLRTGVIIPNTTQRFGLEITTIKKDGKRERIYLTPKIEKPSFNLWDNNTQSFVYCRGVSNEIKQQADFNNQIIDNLLTDLKRIAIETNVQDGKGIKEAYQSTHVCIKQTPENYCTIGKYVERHIERLKKENSSLSENAHRSTNYQVYINLYNKLLNQRTNPKYPRFFDIPLSEMNNLDKANAIYSLWSNYIVEELNGVNLKNLQKYFMAICHKAGKELKLINLACFTFTWDNPTHGKRDKNGIVENDLKSDQDKALTKEEFAALLNYNKNTELSQEKQLYIDTCLLQYYLFSRPRDIVNMNWEHIKKNRQGVLIWSYIPYKLRNKKNSGKYKVCIPITGEALKIIEKYQKEDKQGYVLVFAKKANTRDYNQNYSNFEYQGKKIIEKINRYLKVVDCTLRTQGVLNCNNNLRMYTFRHSAITHAILNHENTAIIAKKAGTSINMIENHYLSKKAITEEMIKNAYESITL